MPCRESPAIREEMKRDLKTELYVILSVYDNTLEELCQTIGDIFSGGLVEAAPLLASSNRTQCSVSRGESGQHPKKQMRLEIIHGVLTTFQQPVEDVMYTGQEIMHGLTKTPYLTLPESSGRRKRHVPSTVLCGILSERDDMLFLCPIQSIRNWSQLWVITPLITRECSSGDTEDRPAITTALLATGA